MLLYEMVLNESVEIKVSSNNLSKLLKFGYADIRVGDIIMINIEHLSPFSHVVVDCKCEMCDKVNKIRYSSYTTSKKNHNFYSCHSCSIEKMKQTNIERWGVSFVSQNKKIRDKQIETNKLKYGVEHYIMLDEVKKNAIEKSKNNDTKEKRKKTYYEKYGVDNPSKCETIKKKIETTNIERYGVKSPAMLEGTRSKYFESIIDSNHCSEFEREVRDYIIEIYKEEVIASYKYKGKKEVDIFLPNLKLAIECNGIFWHSEKFKSKSYHLDKWLELNSSGISLINIWEDDWINKKPILKSILANRLGILKNKVHARKCQIRECKDAKEIRRFLDLNHIQGYVYSKFNFGLYYKDELVSLMCFSNKRNEKSVNELTRFCSKIGYNIIGAASKLFKHFLDKFEKTEIVSFAGINMFTGNVYNLLGFTFLYNTKPDYWWVVDNVRRHKSNYKKKNLIAQGHDNTKTERQIMTDLGFYRVYGIGLSKYIYKK